MSTYEVRLPDGTSMDVPLHITPQEALARAQKAYPEAFRSVTQETPKEGFFENLKAGTRRAVSETGLGIGSLIDEQRARQAYSADKAAEDARGVKTVGLEDVKKAYNERGLLAAMGQLPPAARDLLAQTAPEMAATLAGAKAGAMAGTPLGPAGTIGGALIGGIAAGVPMFFGSNLARQQEAAPAKEFDKTAAATAAVGQSALNTASNLFVLGKVLGITKLAGVPILVLAKTTPEVAQAKLVQEAQRSLLAATGRGVAKGVAVEMPTEVAQQVLERAQAGLPLLDADAVREYQESAFGGALLGGVLGGAAGPVETMQARGQVRRDEAQRAQAVRSAEIEKERQQKEAEEAAKKSPEYLTTLENTYNTNLARIKELDAQIRAFGKVNSDSVEAVQKQQLIGEIKNLKKKQEPIKEEYAKRKAEIEVNKEKARVAGMTPLDYLMEQTPTYSPESLKSKKPFTTEEVVTGAASPAQSYADRQIALGRQLDNGTFTENDFAELLLRDPEQARQVVASDIKFEGFDKKQTAAIKGGIKLKLQELDKKAKKEAAERETAFWEQKQSDLAAQITQPTQPTNVASEVQQQQEELRTKNELNEYGLLPYEHLGLVDKPIPGLMTPGQTITQPEETTGYLDTLFEKATNQPDSPDIVKVPENITPDTVAANRLQRLNSLLDDREAAAARIRKALLPQDRKDAILEHSRIVETLEAAAKEEKGSLGEVLRRRNQQEEALGEIDSALEDLHYGITLDNVASRAESASKRAAREGATEAEQGLVEEKKKADLQGLATGTTKTLNDRIQKLKRQYIQAAIEEAAINRRLFDKNLSKDEALRITRDIRKQFDEWIERAQALPRSAVEERRAYTRRLRDDTWLEKVKQEYIAASLRDALVNKAAREVQTGTHREGATELSPAEQAHAHDIALRRYGDAIGRALPKAPTYEGTGTERKVVSPGRKEAIDPRDLEERSLGAYREATEVYQEEIRRATNTLTRVPEGPRTRDEQLLRTQFAETEAAKVAEARGETAKTKTGEIRRRVEYVSNLIERAQTTRDPLVSPGTVVQALSRAKAALDEGNTSLKLLDAAEELAGRVLDGRKDRQQSNELARDINDAIREVQKAKVEDQAQQGDLFGTEEFGFFRTTAGRFQRALDTSPEVTKAKKAVAVAEEELRVAQIKAKKEATEEIKKRLDAEQQAKDVGAGLTGRIGAVAKSVIFTFDKIKNHIRDVELGNRERAVLEAANDKITAGNLWLVDLEQQLQELRKQTEEQAKQDIRRVPYGWVNARIRSLQDKIDAEKARIARGEQALKKLEERIQRRIDERNLRAEADASLYVQAQRNLLKEEVAELEAQGYIVDVAAGTVTAPDQKTATAQQAELQRQNEAIARAERLQKNVAEENVDNLRNALDERLDLPGRIVTFKTDKRGKKRTTIEEVGSRTNEAIDNAADERAIARRYAEEMHSRKESLEKKKQGILDRAEKLQDATDELRSALEIEKNSKQKTVLQTAIAENMRTIQFLKGQAEAQKLTTAEDWKSLDARRKVSVRRQRAEMARAKVTGKLGAPTSMRAGTAESKARTDAGYLKTLRDASEALGRESGGRELETAKRTGATGPEAPHGYEYTDHPLHGKSLAEAAQYGYERARSPIRKALFKTVAEALKDSKGKVSAVRIGQGRHKNAAATYNDTTDSIRFNYLNQDRAARPVDLEVLLHELTHAATVRGINLDPELAVEVTKIRKIVQNYLHTKEGKAYVQSKFDLRMGNVFESDLSLKTLYGMTNNAEFLAEAFSNTQFQKMLMQIPAQNKRPNLWSRFVHAVAKFFGATNPKEIGILADIMSLAERAMDTTAEGAGSDVDVGSVFESPKSVHDDPATEEAYTTMVGGKGVWDTFKENFLGLGFRVRFIDTDAASVAAFRKGDPVAAIQAEYNLMKYRNKNHLVAQSVTEGPLVRTKSKIRGQDAFVIEAKEGGPTLTNVSRLLADVKGFGNTQATNEAFSLYEIGNRAKDWGWGRIFADLPIPQNATTAQELEIEKENARRETARKRAEFLASDPDTIAKFKQAHDEYQAWNKGMLRFVMQAGVITEEEYRRLSANANYTPAFRADHNNNLQLELDAGKTITVGKIQDEATLQQLRGGSGKLMNFFHASVLNASVLVDAALHNIASRDAALTLQAAGLAHPVNDTEKGPDIIEFRADGKEDRQRFRVETEAVGIPTHLVVKGFEGVPSSMPGIIRVLGMPAQLLRRAVTRNPLYMARQLVRDPLSAWMVTGADMNPVLGTIKEVSKAISGMSDKTLDRRGVTGGMMFAENETDLDRLADEAQSVAKPWHAGWWFAKLDHAALGADAATRRQVYDGAIKEGLSEMEAELAAWKSMPFSKRGASPSVRMANHLIPFLSASIQGWDTMYRAIKGDMPLHERVNVRNKLLQRGALIAGLSLLYAAGMEDDEGYQNLSDQIRLKNWVFRAPGTDTLIKIPVPFEHGVFWKMIPEAAYRAMVSDKDSGDEAKAVFKALLSMLPGALPQAGVPIAEATLNRSFFTGAPIESRALEGLEVGERWDDKTSEMSKWLGQVSAIAGVSPKKLEYMLNAYTAGIYPAMAALIDNMIPAYSETSKPTKTLAQLPVFKTVLEEADSTGEVSRLYDKIESMTEFSRTMKHLAETQPERVQEYFEENSKKIAAGSAAEKMKANLDKFAAIENKIRSVPASAMTPDQKKDALDRVRAAKIAAARQMNASLRALAA